MSKFGTQVRFVGIVSALLWMFAPTAFGEDLVWTGAAGGSWNTGNNWINAAGTAKAFASEDNARIDDSSAGRTATFGGAVAAGDVIFDVDEDFTLRNSNKSHGLSSVKSFTKTGDGTLYISMTKGNTFTNDIEILQGRICTTVANAESPLGNPLVARTIHVHPGAELQFGERNVFGPMQQKNLRVEIRVDKGATFNIEHDPEHFSSTALATVVGSLTLDGGALLYTNGMSAGIGVLKVCDKFTLSGDEPYVFPSFGSSSGFCLNGENDLGLTTTFQVEDISGDARPDVTFKLPLWQDADKVRSGFIKTGHGTMALASNSSTFSGDVEVREGELRLAAQSSIGNVQAGARTLTVSTNATLHLAIRNAIYTPKNVPQLNLVVDHGTLRISCEADGTNSGQSFGDITLDNATLDYAGVPGFSSGYFQKFWFGGKVTLRGETPYVFAPNAGVANMGIHLNNEPLTEFNVADITTNSDVDVTFRHNFVDRYTDTNQMFHASGFVKTGPGTMWLQANRSTFKGNVEIREGEVVVNSGSEAFVDRGMATQTGLGDMTIAGKTITIYTNATLNLVQRNTFISTTPTNNTIKSEVVLNGGKLVLCRDCSAKHASVNGIANLTLIDGELEHPQITSPYGILCVYDTFRIGGTSPHVLRCRNAGTAYLLNHFPTTRFYVEDVTGNHGDDVTFDVLFKDFAGTDYPWAVSGLIKDGPGTMRIVSQCTYRGDTLVSNGVFKVDGSVGCSLRQPENAFPSPTRTICVASGAALAGTGSVYHVSIEAGGGFEIEAGQRKPLKITGDLSLPETGFVDIRNPQGIENLNELTGEIAVVSGVTTGAANIESWPVRVDGEVIKTFHPHVYGNRVYVRNLNGTVILFR